jgi:23S rRNA (adenine1618-N6)-methyltransferase
MLPAKKVHPQLKSKLHPRNRHRERYDFKALTKTCPDLAPFVSLNVYDDESVDFSDPEAVKMLNKALLQHYYDIAGWDVPPDYLVPPVPGRADYIHHMADLLAARNFGKVPSGPQIRCLDIGTGSGCIYPIIGIREYGWSFTGTEIDPVSMESARIIAESNPVLKDKVELRLQAQPNDIYFGIIQPGEFFDLAICNPPFHASQADAREAAIRKLNNLNPGKKNELVLNFGGQQKELWCKGGELKFVQDMIRQSTYFASSCFWFSSLVSKQTHMQSIEGALAKAKAAEVKVIPVGQGNKSVRIVAWTFLRKERQEEWREARWKGDLQPSG